MNKKVSPIDQQPAETASIETAPSGSTLEEVDAKSSCTLRSDVSLRQESADENPSEGDGVVQDTVKKLKYITTTSF